MFSVFDLRRYLAYCKKQLANAIYDDQKRFYTKAIAQTEVDIKNAQKREHNTTNN